MPLPSSQAVRWAELLPHQFLDRLSRQPVVYLPLGLCEPHGPIATFGLDTLKADYLCDEAARRFGGIVAPTMGYHIHEAGFHAPWLAEVVGNVPPRMTSMPPHVMLYFFLYQLRAFYNAGFAAVVVISGHSGGNQIDFRTVAEGFSQQFGLPVFVASDPELAEGQFTGDHAGAYELSQLLAIRPDLVDLSRDYWQVTDPALHRFAQGDDAAQATTTQGKAILEACLKCIGDMVAHLQITSLPERIPLTYAPIEALWQTLFAARHTWRTYQPVSGPPVPDTSIWYAYTGEDRGGLP